MKLDVRSIGEFGLLKVLRKRAASHAAHWAQAIGDDAAILRPRHNRDLVMTADALVEDVHFRWATTDARSLGHKALAVNLSDLAAMGATPRGFLLSLAIPPIAVAERLDGFVSGLLTAAKRFSCPLVGGDVVSSPAWMLSVTAVGDVPRGKGLLRGGARAGDRVFLTGDVGASALGLALLDSELAQKSPFTTRHLRPQPRLEAGQALVRSKLATAALDVSDGVAQDLAHLAQESGLAADLHADRLPLARGFAAACEKLGLDPVDLALAGGEDFELLFAAGPKAPTAAVLAKRLGCRVTEVGVMRRGKGVRVWRDGVRMTPSQEGFDHFKPVSSQSDK